MDQQAGRQADHFLEWARPVGSSGMGMGSIMGGKLGLACCCCSPDPYLGPIQSIETPTRTECGQCLDGGRIGAT